MRVFIIANLLALILALSAPVDCSSNEHSLRFFSALACGFGAAWLLKPERATTALSPIIYSHNPFPGQYQNPAESEKERQERQDRERLAYSAQMGIDCAKAPRR